MCRPSDTSQVTDEEMEGSDGAAKDKSKAPLVWTKDIRPLKEGE